jgi:hypothetical protein
MKLNRYAASVLLLYAVSGCGGSSVDAISGQSSQPSSVASSNYYVHGPSVQGQVEVASASGEVLAQAPALAGLASLTLPEAVFLGRAQGTSSLFVRFTPDDPTDLGSTGEATLWAEDPLPEKDDVVGVDAVSSLIALYHREHPELSFEQAALKVFAHLGLPEDSDPEHYFEDSIFEADLFHAEAARNGGVDSLLELMVAEVENGPTTRRPLLIESTLRLPTLDDFASRLFDSALGFVQGELEGWLQGVIGLPRATTLDDVLNAIESLRADIDKLSQQIADTAARAAYDAKIAQLTNERANLKTDNQTLAGWFSRAARNPVPQSQVDEFMRGISEHYGRGATLKKAFELEMPSRGAGGNQPGAIGLSLNASLPRLYSAANKQDAMEHLEGAIGFQQSVLNLVVEGLHYEIPSKLAEAEGIIDTYFANAKSYQQQYPLPFDEENVLLDRGTNLLWSRRPLAIDDVRKIDSFLRSYALGGSPPGAWRVPFTHEFRPFVWGSGRSNEVMKSGGFLPINGSSVVGDWGTTYPYLALTYPLVGSRTFEAHMVDVRDSAIVERGVVSERQVNVPYDVATVAFYVVRPAPTVESLSLALKSVDRWNVYYSAQAALSDGTSRDVTALVRWSVRGAGGQEVSSDVARISNIPGDEGHLTFRESGRAVSVGAIYNNVQQFTGVDQGRTFTAPLKSVVVSPVNYQVPSGGFNGPNNTFTRQYFAQLVLENGDVDGARSTQDPSKTDWVRWSTSDSSVSIDQNGVILASRPSAQKVVTITATQPGVGVVGTATLILGDR